MKLLFEEDRYAGSLVGTVQRQSALLGGGWSSWGAEGLTEVRGGVRKGRGRPERGFDMMRDAGERRTLEGSHDHYGHWFSWRGGERRGWEGRRGSCGFYREEYGAGLAGRPQPVVPTCGPTRGDSLQVQADESPHRPQPEGCARLLFL